MALRRGRGSSDDARQKMTTIIIVVVLVKQQIKDMEASMAHLKNCGWSDFNSSEDSNASSVLFDENHSEDDENTSGVGSIDVYP